MTLAARCRCGIVIALLGVAAGGAVHARRADSIHSSPTVQTLNVGSLTLTRCPASPAYCGQLERPIDPLGVTPGRLAIHFEYYPHLMSGKSLGTIVATEGGPGFPATESRDDYVPLFKPLLAQRDLLLMDNRGTGRSGAVDCHPLQSADTPTVELIGACGESLGARAPLYSTAYAADDMAAILQALQIDRIDLYGDSYGTYFAQVFAIRHPEKLRSIVLDGAYPLDGVDYPWYTNYAAAMRDKFNLACRRFEACVKRPGSSLDRIQPVIEELRLHPFRAQAADSGGTMRDFTANASQLAIVMFGSAPALVTVRELDAAAVAFTAGDKVPLLRLMAETISAVDSRDPTADPTKWSAGLAAAVMCQDPPQIFDMRLSPAMRIKDRDQAIAKRKRAFPGTYAPFTIDEYRGMPLDYNYIDQCVMWPVAAGSHPASQTAGAGARYPDIPVMVLSGEFDNITSVAEGAAAAATFKHGRQILVANSFHVNALPRARSTCGAELVRRFVASLSPGDTSCAAAVAPLRLVPLFAIHYSQVAPATALPGNQAPIETLHMVSAAVATVGDVLVRLGENSTGRGVGLRGGVYSVVSADSGTHVVLDQVRWTQDLAVSGSIDEQGRRPATVQVDLHLAAAGITGDIALQWSESDSSAPVTIRGEFGGAKVLAQAPVP